MDPSAFAAVLVGLAALPDPTLISCFHSRSVLEDYEPMTWRHGHLLVALDGEAAGEEGNICFCNSKLKPSGKW